MEPSENQFVITLPSNSQEGNTASKFRTQLPAPINFGSEWEFGLNQILYNHTWENLTKPSQIVIAVPVLPEPDPEASTESPASPPSGGSTKRRTVAATVPSGYYDDTAQLVRIVNSSIKTVAGAGIELTYHTTERRVYIKVSAGYALLFDDQLSQLLGFRKQTTIARSTAGDPRITSNSDLTCIYVYTNIAKPQITGNTQSPLLQLIPVSGSYGEVEQFSPRKVLYIPLRSNIVSSIEIQLCNSDGELIDFKTGHTVVQLHFQKRLSF